MYARLSIYMEAYAYMCTHRCDIKVEGIFWSGTKELGRWIRGSEGLNIKKIKLYVCKTAIFCMTYNIIIL